MISSFFIVFLFLFSQNGICSDAPRTIQDIKISLETQNEMDQALEEIKKEDPEDFQKLILLKKEERLELTDEKQ